MMTTRSLLAFGILCAGLTATQATAEPIEFQIDRSHSHIGFDVHHLGFSRTIGRFDDYAGIIMIDDKNPEAGSAEVTIKTASVDTNHKKRDDHLRSEDFFNAAKFPTMTFKSTAIKMMDEKHGQITGQFTLLGVTKPVTLNFQWTRDAPASNPAYFGIRTVGFQAEGKIKRTDFGMNKFVGNSIGDEVSLSLYFDAIRCTGEAAKAPSCSY
jgi:polyisoprenoid-binding protein YceI